MSDRISVSIDDGIADVRLNRPDKRNALDPAMFAALADTAASLAGDSSVRCVVLSGEGQSFCAGLDFASFQGMTDEDGSRAAGTVTDPLDGRITHGGQQAVYGWTEMPAPVIAAVHGHALGGGCQLALGADIRIAAPGTKLSILEIRWGLIPDMTGTQTLIELVGLDVAKELTFTGRMVEAEEALELGLVTRVTDEPQEAALALAAEIGSKSPHAIRAAKRLFNQASKVSVADGFAAERHEIGQLIGSENQVEAVKAYFEQRPPRFSNPADD